MRSRVFAILVTAAALVAVAVSVAFARPDPAARAKANRDYWRHRYAVEHVLRKRVERRQGMRVRVLRSEARANRRYLTALLTTVRAVHKQLANERRLARQRRILAAHEPSSLEALRLASIAYGQPYADLLRVAECESPGLDARLVNREPVGREHATGLMQFLPSTYASTPYRDEDILSPYANALSAGWMWAHGRRGEWACR